MRVYVAGKTHDYERIREIQGALRAEGSVITHDWTSAVEHHGPEHEVVDPSPVEQAMYAEADRRGVVQSDLVIALGHPMVCGTLWEAGMASALRIPVVLVDWHIAPNTIFKFLDNVSMMTYRDLFIYIRRGEFS